MSPPISPFPCPPPPIRPQPKSPPSPSSFLPSQLTLSTPHGAKTGDCLDVLIVTDYKMLKELQEKRNLNNANNNNNANDSSNTSNNNKDDYLLPLSTNDFILTFPKTSTTAHLKDLTKGFFNKGKSLFTSSKTVGVGGPGGEANSYSNDLPHTPSSPRGGKRQAVKDFFLGRASGSSSSAREGNMKDGSLHSNPNAITLGTSNLHQVNSNGRDLNGNVKGGLITSPPTLKSSAPAPVSSSRMRGDSFIVDDAAIEEKYELSIGAGVDLFDAGEGDFGEDEDTSDSENENENGGWSSDENDEITHKPHTVVQPPNGTVTATATATIEESVENRAKRGSSLREELRINEVKREAERSKSELNLADFMHHGESLEDKLDEAIFGSNEASVSPTKREGSSLSMSINIANAARASSNDWMATLEPGSPGRVGTSWNSASNFSHSGSGSGSPTSPSPGVGTTSFTSTGVRRLSGVDTGLPFEPWSPTKGATSNISGSPSTRLSPMVAMNSLPPSPTKHSHSYNYNSNSNNNDIPGSPSKRSITKSIYRGLKSTISTPNTHLQGTTSTSPSTTSKPSKLKIKIDTRNSSLFDNPSTSEPSSPTPDGPGFGGIAISSQLNSIQNPYSFTRPQIILPNTNGNSSEFLGDDGFTVDVYINGRVCKSLQMRLAGGVPTQDDDNPDTEASSESSWNNFKAQTQTQANNQSAGINSNTNAERGASGSGFATFSHSNSSKPMIDRVRELVLDGVISPGRNAVRYENCYWKKVGKRQKIRRSVERSVGRERSIGRKSASNYDYGAEEEGGMQVKKRFSEGYIYLWDHTSNLILSDIDGTVTKSDVVGLIDSMALNSYEHVHRGICNFYSQLSDFGTNKQSTMPESGDVKFVYLTSRPISLMTYTRKFLAGLSQNGDALPPGLTLCHTGTVKDVLICELIKKNPQVFKARCLKGQVCNVFRDVQRQVGRLLTAQIEEKDEDEEAGSECEDFLSPQLESSSLPPKLFLAGFGNKLTDMQAYLSIGLVLDDIYIISKSSQILCESDRAELEIEAFELVKGQGGVRANMRRKGIIQRLPIEIVSAINMVEVDGREEEQTFVEAVTRRARSKSVTQPGTPKGGAASSGGNDLGARIDEISLNDEAPPLPQAMSRASSRTASRSVSIDESHHFSQHLQIPPSASRESSTSRSRKGSIAGTLADVRLRMKEASLNSYDDERLLKKMKGILDEAREFKRF